MCIFFILIKNSHPHFVRLQLGRLTFLTKWHVDQTYLPCAGCSCLHPYYQQLFALPTTPVLRGTVLCFPSGRVSKYL